MKFLTLLFFTALPFAALAQEGRTIKIRLLCFEMVPGPREVVVSGDPTLSNTAEIVLGRRLRSEQDRLTIMGPRLTLGTLGTNAEQQPVLDPIAVATIPASGDQFLILLLPTGKKKGELYKAMVMSDDRRDFPSGAFRMVNLSPSALRFAMGDERLDLPPGGIKVLEKVAGAREDGRFGYVVQYKEGDVWNRLSTGYWNYRENVRSLQIAVLDPRTKRITMRAYDDTLRPPPVP